MSQNILSRPLGHGTIRDREQSQRHLHILSWMLDPSNFLILSRNSSRPSWPIFLLRQDWTKMAAYVPLLGRIRSSYSSTDFWLPKFLHRPPFQVLNLAGSLTLFLLLSFCVDLLFGFSIYLLYFLTLFFFWLSFYIDHPFRFSIYLFA